ncbi:hypothetical protein [Paractinoplanes rishiriensis]|uniref:Uncharacterized protein n=1 Tax=Paractinoplanes rishiriensis TaxID=1050105 RepID=A0A919K7E2_9ACTN|nr:hypothetical protein [Actinoplanes rishiriensis]GIF02346.1 hypothetical protein Ari01nite_98100 [Actinoplanes rishiriensis]
MGKKYLFTTDPETGESRELRVDPAHVDRQMRDERAAGRNPVLMDEDERIRMGLLAQQIAAAHRDDQHQDDPRDPGGPHDAPAQARAGRAEDTDEF